jgi:hypothetical protein
VRVVVTLCAGRRLPTALRIELINASLFDEYIKGAQQLHGRCLLIAELLRRGVLPPELFEPSWREVITPAAFCYELRGAVAMGSAARDAAAFACWAAARANIINVRKRECSV